MTTQPKALRLAERMESYDEERSGYAQHCHAAAAELRRLYKSNQELLGALHTITSLAVGEGDVCEIIAKRARAAIAKAERELLELAAKACGLEEAKMRIEFNQWNPLEDDGDALRLAVKLQLFIRINSGSATAWKWRGENWYEQASDYADDMGATTRRAIVRAAAEIGRSMK